MGSGGGSVSLLGTGASWQNAPDGGNGMTLPGLGGEAGSTMPNYKQTIKQVVEGQRNVLPLIYSAEKSWGPLFNNMALQNMQEMSPKYQQLILDLQKQFAPQNIEWLMEMNKRYNSQIMRQQEEQMRQAREIELNAIKEYAPQLKSAIEALNPQQVKLQEALGKRATDEFNLGSQLDPQAAREIQQAVRGGQMARGMTMGNAPVSTEANLTWQQGQALKRQREGNAFNYLSLPQFNAMQALGLGKDAYSQANAIPNSMAGSGTEGLGMFKDRSPTLIDTAVTPSVYSTASQNWAAGNNLAQSYLRQGAGGGGSPWMNMLPLAGAGLGAGIAGLAGMDWGSLFGGGGVNGLSAATNMAIDAANPMYMSPMAK